MKLRQILVALGMLAVVPLVSAAEDPNLARNLAATCANCHGTNGKALPGSGMDALAGMSKEKIMQKVKDFKTGAKPGTIMPQIAKGYSDEQLALIAGYFAGQK